MSREDTVRDMGGWSRERLVAEIEAAQRENASRRRRAIVSWWLVGGALACVLAGIAVFLAGMRTNFQAAWIWIVLLALEVGGFALLGLSGWTDRKRR